MIKAFKLLLFLCVISGTFFIASCTDQDDQIIEISFHTNGGNVIDPITFETVDTFEWPEHPSKEGYEFDGWFIDNDSFEIVFDSLSLETTSENIIVYAKWRLISYDIYYELNGGTNHANNPIAYEHGAESIVLNDPSKEGFAFDGWFIDEELLLSFDSTELLNEPFTLYAKWLRQSYTISFEPNNDSSINQLTYAYEEEVWLPSEITKIGYIFVGWYMDEELTTLFDHQFMPANDFTLYAKWRDENEIDYDSLVELGVAINYAAGGRVYGISYQNESSYQALNGNFYTKGDLLPVWERIGEILNIEFNDVSTSADANTNAQFSRLQTEGFAGVDLVNGFAMQFQAEGIQGNFVDLNDYLHLMPHLSAYLEQNQAIKVSITASDGGIYFTPYFDGYGELEQMYMARIDWIEDILDSTNPSFDSTPGFVPNHYTRRQVQTPINVLIQVANPDGSVRTVTKAYTTNILDTLAGLTNPTGATVAQAFRTHMQNTYGSQYAKLSDVFVGTDAAYDTDELVALMYVVKSNPQYLTREYTNGPLSSLEIMFPRESTGNRIRNLFRGMEMFGLRGVFSRHEWLYFDESGELNDIRHEQKLVDGINDLAAMYADGLIIQNPEEGGNHRHVLLTRGDGFITYDYNATSTSINLMNAGRMITPNFKFQAILPPVVDWLGDGNYFHFSEATRSVKNEAWGIPSHVEENRTKLHRALKLIDEMYDYSRPDSIGTIHLYGPEDWVDGTIEYGDDFVYKMSDEAIAEISSLAGGNYISYLRQYVGATLPIGHIRSMGLEYQTLTDQGRIGIDRIKTAIDAGTFKLAGMVESNNPWYQLSPTFFPLTSNEAVMIEVTANFRYVFLDNQLVNMVKYGFSGNGGSLTEEQYWESFLLNSVDIYEAIYMKSYRDAYQRAMN
jgi:uncharacterized repeat protein (TIGR02543 family)